MPRETVAELKMRIEQQGLEMLELEMKLDATEAELLEALRALCAYQKWHIDALQKQEEE